MEQPNTLRPYAIPCFNLTLYYLLLSHSLTPLFTSSISLPLWTDCCHFLSVICPPSKSHDTAPNQQNKTMALLLSYSPVFSIVLSTLPLPDYHQTISHPTTPFSFLFLLTFSILSFASVPVTYKLPSAQSRNQNVPNTQADNLT